MGSVTDYFEDYNNKKMKLTSFEELVDKVNALLNGQLTIVTLLSTLEASLKQKENIASNLADKVEIRSVNTVIEQKLDKIIAISKDISETNRECLGVLRELLEKLVPQSVTINPSISVKSEEGRNVDINKSLYELANDVQRRRKT